MSDNYDPTTSQSPAGAAHNSSAGSFRKTVRLVLFAILGLMIVAIVYDYLYARPAVDKAYDKIAALNNEINISAGAKVLTSDEVHTALGRNPSRIEKEESFTIEVYQWRAGLPWRTYDYHVVYLGEKTLAFSTHFKNERPPMDSLAPPMPAGTDSEVPGGVPGGPPAGDPAMGGAPGAGTGPGQPPGESNGRGRPALEDADAAGSSTPDPATPDPATPDPATPEAATPEPTTPETATPETATPETATPEAATPEAATPETATPETATPETGEGGSP